MTHPFRISTAARRGLGFVCVLVVGICALPGCHSSLPFLRQNQFGPPLPRDASQAEIVGRVNDNITKVHSWRSTDVHVSGGGMVAMRIGADIAVEGPRNFRMRASALGSEEADFGSNDERFWFWVKRSEMPYVFLASHEQMGESEILRQIPFQPEWLMEVLGVVPLNEEEFTLSFDDTAERTAVLKSERVLPSGQPVRRIIRVDTRYGRIWEQSLYGADGHGANGLIAKASLSKHERDPATGAILPRLIQIEWPQPKNQKLKLNIEIGHIEVNPPHMPSQMWDVPEKNGFRTVDLCNLKNGPPGRNGRPTPNRFAGPSREPLEPLDRDRFVMPARGEGGSAAPGKVRLQDLSDLSKKFPEPAEESAVTAEGDLPPWAREPIPNNPNKSRQRTPSSPQHD